MNPSLFLPDKLKSSAIQIQRTILAYALRSPLNADTLVSKADIGCFSEDFTRNVFQAIKDIVTSGGTPSPQMVHLSISAKAGAVQYYTVFDMLKEIDFVSYDFDDLLSVLMETRIRDLIQKKALDLIANVGDVSQDIQTTLASLRELAETPVGYSRGLTRTPREIWDSRKDEDPNAGRILSGDWLLDDYYFKNGGSRRGQIEFIMAHTGHGKTQFAGARASLYARQGYHVAWFQFEDIEDSVIDIAVNNAKNHEHDIRQFDQYFENHQQFWHITDSANMIEEIEEECRMLRNRNQLDVVVIDYIQLLDARGFRAGQDREKLSTISKKLTRLAKNFKCYVMVTSQLRRPDDSKTGWNIFPRIRDMKETSQYEQDAFVVTAIFRPAMEPSLVHGEQVKWYDHKDHLPNFRPLSTVAMKCLKNRRQPLDHKVIELFHNYKGMHFAENRDLVKGYL
jgi:replicative DNA helicase